MDLLTLAAAPSSDEIRSMIPLIAIALGSLIAVVAIVGGMIRSTLRTSAIEKTKRELAAYVAEGSMRPEDAERILNAGGSPESGGGCMRR